LNTLLLLIVLAQAGVTLVPGTTSTYTDGTYTWAGNPWCAESGLLLQPTSPAIDQGAITDLHCPAAGPSSQFPANADGSPCNEWYGLAPDIGACEYVPSGVQPPPPSGFPVVLDSTLSQPPEEKTVTVNISKPQNAVTVTMRMQGNDAEPGPGGEAVLVGGGCIELGPGGLVERAGVLHQQRRLRGVLADLQPVFDQHPERGAPVTDVVLPDHGVAEGFEHLDEAVPHHVRRSPDPVGGRIARP